MQSRNQTRNRVALAAMTMLLAGTIQSAIADPTASDPWVSFGIATQRDSIARDEPINWVMRLGTHNAYESFAYGHNTDPNQSLSISTQLTRGARIISIDLHVLDDDLWLCHNDYCAFDKSGLEPLLEEIGNFVSVRQDFVWVQIEYRPYAGCTFFATPDNECNDGSLNLNQVVNKLEAAISDKLDQGAGLVWRPNEAIEIGPDEYVHPNYSSLAKYCSGNGLFCSTDSDCPSGQTCDRVIPSGATHRRRYPTLRELQAANKRIMVTATGMTGCCGNDCGPYDKGSNKCSGHSLNAGDTCSDGNDCKGLEYATSWVWDDGNSGGVISGSGSGYSSDGDTFNYGLCETEDGNPVWDPTEETGGGYPIIPSVGEDRTIIGIAGTGAAVEFDEMAILAKCNTARINLDFFDAAQDMSAEACCYLFDGPDCPFVAECPAEDFRVAAAVWSWKYDQIPDADAGHDYVFMSGVDGKWNGGIPQNNFRCACGVSREGEPLDWADKRGDTWDVTTAKGFWEECPNLCEAEFGSLSTPLVFELPPNGHANERLWAALQAKSAAENTDLTFENAWLRFRRDASSQWQRSVLPAIDSIEVAPSMTDPLELDFTFRVKNADDFPVQLFLAFEDGRRPILDMSTIENDLYVFRASFPFGTEGDMTLGVDLYYGVDGSTTLLRFLESRDFDFTFEVPNTPPVIDAFTSATRTDLREICEDVCIGHLLDWTVRITDPDSDFTTAPDCSTIWGCQKGIRVFYGDGTDSVCSGGTCTGASGGTRSCTNSDDCGQFVLPEQVTSLGGGLYEFSLSHLYQASGAFNGKIIVNDGADEVVHEFTIFNLDPSVDPVIVPGSSGCTGDLLQGETAECSVVFIDSNPDIDTFALDVDWGDGTNLERITDVSVSSINASTHVAFFDHTYNVSSEPGKFPIRVMVTDDAGLPGDSCSNDSSQSCSADSDCGSGNTCVPGVCSADLMTPCSLDLDCGGSCRLTSSALGNGSRDLCSTDADCGMACENEPDRACTTDADCQNGGTCGAQFCQAEDVCRIENASEIRYCTGTSTECTGDADCSGGTCGGLFEIEVFAGNTPVVVCPIEQATCGITSDTGGDVTINQGETFSRTFRVQDPDVNDVQELSVRYSPELNALFPPIENDMFTLSHTYNNPGTFELVFRVSSSFVGPITQNSTGALSIFVTVLSTNETPVFDATLPLSASEGSPLLAQIGFTDSDADAWTASVTYGDGASDDPATVDQSGKTVEMSHTYGDNGAYLASLVLSDGIDSTVTNVTVNVANVAPNVASPSASNGSPQEGDAISVDATFTDAGTNDGPFTCTIDYGDGSPVVAGTVVAGECQGPSHSYGDDGTYTVIVSVTDKDSGTGTNSIDVTVLNADPVTSAPSLTNATPNEGGGTTASATFTDAGSDDGPYTCTVDYGDGSGSQAGTVSGDTCTGPAHVYDDNGSYDVTITIEDKDGGTGDNMTTVNVNNVAPTASLTSPADATEGSTFMLTLSGEFDPSSADTSAGFTYAFDCGSGYGPFSATASATCDADNEGTLSVGGIIRDKDGGESEYAASVEVLNAPPMISSLTVDADVVPVDQLVTATATFTDAGTLDAHTATFDWDAVLNPGVTTIAGVVSYGATENTATSSLAYAEPGVYTVKATVADDAGDADDASYEYVVVFDPDGNFVSGGGSIDSPAGAYRPDQTLAGPAQFGFVSRYARGRTVPEGNTEFRFRAADFRFKSVSYDWLVVAGDRAQFKGVGEVGGEGDYGFLLTAIDAEDGDRFRIKIWDRTTDEIVYDNEIGRKDDGDPTTVISSGSIVIHSKRNGR